MASKPPTFVRQVLVRSTSLEIKQCYIGDVGCVVWDAALVLTKFLENKFYFSNEYWKDKYVLELGAGTGIVGLATASLGYSVSFNRSQCGANRPSRIGRINGNQH
jgi:predicted nicotinamide N-methyase